MSTAGERQTWAPGRGEARRGGAGSGHFLTGSGTEEGSGADGNRIHHRGGASRLVEELCGAKEIEEGRGVGERRDRSPARRGDMGEGEGIDRFEGTEGYGELGLRVMSLLYCCFMVFRV